MTSSPPPVNDPLWTGLTAPLTNASYRLFTNREQRLRLEAEIDEENEEIKGPLLNLYF